MIYNLYVKLSCDILWFVGDFVIEKGSFYKNRKLLK